MATNETGFINSQPSMAEYMNSINPLMSDIETGYSEESGVSVPPGGPETPEYAWMKEKKSQKKSPGNYHHYYYYWVN